MRRFYLAGPMRGIPEYNFPAFDSAARKGREKGFHVVSPADLDRENDIDSDIALEEVNKPQMLRAFVRRDINALLSLRSEAGDGIALLPGWETSTGAVAEVAVARWLGLSVVDARTWREFEVDALADLDLEKMQSNILRFVASANDD